MAKARKIETPGVTTDDAPEVEVTELGSGDAAEATATTDELPAAAEPEPTPPGVEAMVLPLDDDEAEAQARDLTPTPVLAIPQGTIPNAADIDPKKIKQSVLTAQGWVVPE